jgi:hypothetical protein
MQKDGNKMDLVYLYRHPPYGGDTELRYSLRSAEKHLDFDRVFVVGDKPEFLQGLNHIEFIEVGEDRHRNSSSKIFTIANTLAVSDDFIFMNDDFFILTDMKPVPFYTISIDHWFKTYYSLSWRQTRMLKTMELLSGDMEVFEVHAPIVMNRQNILNIFEKFNLPQGSMFRTLYGNEYADETVMLPKDYKAADDLSLQEMLKDNPPFFSTSDELVVTPLGKKLLDDLYPVPSKYEKSGQ